MQGTINIKCPQCIYVLVVIFTTNSYHVSLRHSPTGPSDRSTLFYVSIGVYKAPALSAARWEGGGATYRILEFVVGYFRQDCVLLTDDIILDPR